MKDILCFVAGLFSIVLAIWLISFGFSKYNEVTKRISCAEFSEESGIQTNYIWEDACYTVIDGKFEKHVIGNIQSKKD